MINHQDEKYKEIISLARENSMTMILKDRIWHHYANHDKILNEIYLYRLRNTNILTECMLDKPILKYWFNNILSSIDVAEDKGEENELHGNWINKKCLEKIRRNISSLLMADQIETLQAVIECKISNINPDHKNVILNFPFGKICFNQDSISLTVAKKCVKKIFDLDDLSLLAELLLEDFIFIFCVLSFLKKDVDFYKIDDFLLKIKGKDLKDIFVKDRWRSLLYHIYSDKGVLNKVEATMFFEYVNSILLNQDAEKFYYSLIYLGRALVETDNIVKMTFLYLCAELLWGEKKDKRSAVKIRIYISALASKSKEDRNRNNNIIESFYSKRNNLIHGNVEKENPFETEREIDSFISLLQKAIYEEAKIRATKGSN
ncbi:MAG: hypothetical protein K2Q14_00930 [Gammaproteobacteria bacterium]|nr:hypothetical protein [Gammaproteobacteria bacterium]